MQQKCRSIFIQKRKWSKSFRTTFLENSKFISIKSIGSKGQMTSKCQTQEKVALLYKSEEDFKRRLLEIIQDHQRGPDNQKPMHER